MIPLEMGDVVVAAVNHRDYVLVFTAMGHCFRVWPDVETGVLMVQKQ